VPADGRHLAALRWRQDCYLFIIGAVVFAAATIGYQHRRRHRPGDTGHIAGTGTAYVAMLTAFYVDNGPHLPLWGSRRRWCQEGRARPPQMWVGVTRMKCAGISSSHGSSPAPANGARSASVSI